MPERSTDFRSGRSPAASATDTFGQQLRRRTARRGRSRQHQDRALPERRFGPVSIENDVAVRCRVICAPGRNRTCGLPLRRRSLYPLSYWSQPRKTMSSTNSNRQRIDAGHMGFVPPGLVDIPEPDGTRRPSEAPRLRHQARRQTTRSTCHLCIERVFALFSDSGFVLTARLIDQRHSPRGSSAFPSWVARGTGQINLVAASSAGSGPERSPVRNQSHRVSTAD